METHPGAGCQARAAEGRTRRANIFQPDSISSRTPGSLYRQNRRPTCVLPYCSGTMQVVWSCFTSLAPFFGLSMDSKQFHSRLPPCISKEKISSQGQSHINLKLKKHLSLFIFHLSAWKQDLLLKIESGFCLVVE